MKTKKQNKKMKKFIRALTEKFPNVEFTAGYNNCGWIVVVDDFEFYRSKKFEILYNAMFKRSGLLSRPVKVCISGKCPIRESKIDNQFENVIRNE